MGRSERPGNRLEVMEGHLEGEEKLGKIYKRWEGRPHHTEFEGLIPHATIKNDNERLAYLKEHRESGQNIPENRMSRAMEVCLKELVHQHGSLGPADVENSAEADDEIRGVDFVVIFDQGEDKPPLLLAVDATCTEHIGYVEEKIGHSLDRIKKDGSLNEVRYLRSEDHPDLTPQHFMPRIVLGVKSSKGQEILHDFMDSQSKDTDTRRRANQKLEKGPLTQAVREQAVNQLAYQLELASQKLSDDYLSSRLDTNKNEARKIRELQVLLEPITRMDDVGQQIQSEEWAKLVSFLKEPANRQIFEQGEQERRSTSRALPLVENIYKILALFEHINKVKEDSPDTTSGGAGQATEDDPVGARLGLHRKELLRVY